MKNLIILMCLNICWCCQAQNVKTTKKTLHFEQNSAENTLIVENINGDIQVEGYEGDKVELELITTIDAKSEKLINKGFEEIKLGLIEKEDLILIYMDNPCSPDKKVWSKKELLEGRSFNWKNNCDWEHKYFFKMDFKLKVPKNLNIRVSTINDGEVTLQGVKGKVNANNINGGIRLKSLAAATKAHTINGNVEVSYQKNPQGECDFYTLNGNIKVDFQTGLSANLSVETQHGDVYTNVDDVEILPHQKTKTKTEKGIKYKLGGANNLKVRNGGPQLKFETFNGNITIKEN